jgi:hypothetical protein
MDISIRDQETGHGFTPVEMTRPQTPPHVIPSEVEESLSASHQITFYSPIKLPGMSPYLTRRLVMDALQSK